jgi:sugar phosphate isomerase/epimerase
MKLSCTSSMVPGDSLEEKALKLKKWGFDGIAVFADYVGWNEKKLSEVKGLYEKTGIIPCEFVFMDPVYGHLMDDDIQLRQSARAMYKDAIRVCREIGAITEMEYDYRAQDPLPLFEPYKQMSAEQEKGFLELLAELAEVTRGSSAQILIEPINRYETQFLTRIQDCKTVLNKANLPNTGILADLFHLSIEEANLPASLRSARGMIKHVHLADNNRLLPGYGNIDWKACISALKDAEFDGFMNLECAIPGDIEVELPKTVRFLRQMMNQ